MSETERLAKLRPAFPRQPLNPSCVDPAELSTIEKDEVVELIRKVQTDFDPESDPWGWDSVAVLVRGVRYTREEVGAMGYPELCATFRTSGGQMRLQKTGSLNYGIATATASIVLLKSVEPKKHVRDKSCKEVLREWWKDPQKHMKIVEAGSAAKIGFLIGFKASAVKESGRIWSEISPEVELHRRELRNIRERCRAEEERLGG